MPSIFLIMVALLFLGGGYRVYGSFLSRWLGIEATRKTPAHTQQDGVDYVPAKMPILLGHHFASIAGAGPIIGPIFAAVYGWLPVYLWILLGSLFIGGIHDVTALVASIRHGGRSIGEVIEAQIGRTGKQIFLVFTWFMLILVVAVFMNTVATTFVAEPASGTASFLFIGLAIVFGLLVYQKGVSLGWASLIGVALLVGCVGVGLLYPLPLAHRTWVFLLIGYISAASVLPVWLLLQPRDYLNAFLLYLIILGSLIGLFAAHPTVAFRPTTHFTTDLGFLFPILFVTVACGAISGFHALVGSGTTAKQLDRETDAIPVGYGAMLIEGILAVIALLAAVTLRPPEYFQVMGKGGGGPIGVFASGVGGFISVLGIPPKVSVTFAALAVSAFAMTSLDTATRLGRLIWQEFFDRAGGLPGGAARNRFVATGVTVGAASLLSFSGTAQTLWPLFGTANQLLAALVLLAVTVWLANAKKKTLFVRIPMVFMFAVTLSALGLLVYENVRKRNGLFTMIGLLLFFMAGSLLIESIRRSRPKGAKALV